MAYELSWTDYSRADYERLDGVQRVIVDKGLARIRERGMQAGQALSGDLAGCRRLKYRKLGLRIIFRELAGRMEVIEIVAIGQRAGSRVYGRATKRVGGDGSTV